MEGSRLHDGRGVNKLVSGTVQYRAVKLHGTQGGVRWDTVE